MSIKLTKSSPKISRTLKTRLLKVAEQYNPEGSLQVGELTKTSPRRRSFYIPQDGTAPILITSIDEAIVDICNLYPEYPNHPPIEQLLINIAEQQALGEYKYY